jgi:hypothetical protein
MQHGPTRFMEVSVYQTTEHLVGNPSAIAFTLHHSHPAEFLDGVGRTWEIESRRDSDINQSHRPSRHRKKASDPLGPTRQESQTGVKDLLE